MESSGHDRGNPDYVLTEISEKCIECDLCVKQCAFLKKYGTPKSIADGWLTGQKTAPGIAFECSLCALCKAVCPVGIDPYGMFLEMRRYITAQGKADFSKQKLLVNFEKRGLSRRYSFYGLPDGCDTVLFPGCALAGSRSKRVIQLYRHLQKRFSHLGIVLDCCTKPSHQLGRSDFFHAMFFEMHDYLFNHGVKNVLTACPSCNSVFTKYSKGITARSVYEILARETREPVLDVPGPGLTIQDSCVARYENNIQESVRKIIQEMGIPWEEMKHHGKKTLCCGEGGGAHFVAPDLTDEWSRIRRDEAHSRCIITYCAGCASFLGKIGSTAHLLDLFFEPAATLGRNIRVTKSPMTYLKRLLLKRWFRKNHKYPISRERNYFYQDGG